MAFLRFRAFAVTILVVLAPACTKGSENASFSGGVENFAESKSVVPEASTTTTTFTAASIVLSPDGLGVLPFGKQAAQALGGLTQALGRAEDWRPISAPSACDATRIFTWKNFDVLVNETTMSSGGVRGLVGWVLRSGGPDALPFRTDRGIGIGSTVAALEAAYGEAVSVGSVTGQPTATITFPSGVMIGELDGLGPKSTIRSLWAGTPCEG